MTPLLPDTGFTLRRLAANAALFRQGDPARTIFLVEEGAVRLERKTIDGRLVVLHTARPGQLLAEAALFSAAYHCDAVAVRPSRVRAYAKAPLLAELKRNPDAAETLLKTLASQVQALRLKLELRNVRSARDRLLLLLELRADAGRCVTLAGPLQDLADELGLTREALYRTLARLEGDGLIERRPGAILLSRLIG